MDSRKSDYKKRYYTKLMLINTMLIVLCAAIFGIITSVTTSKLERSKFIKLYDQTLYEMNTDYSMRKKNLANLLTNFYTSLQVEPLISSFFDSPESGELESDLFSRKQIVEMIQRACNMDIDIKAALMYKKQTGEIYEYKPDKMIIEKVNESTPFYDDLAKKSVQTGIFPARQLLKNTYVYGLAGTLNTDSKSFDQLPGSVMFAYDVNGIDKIILAKAVSRKSRFLIIKKTGELIYDSNKLYSDSYAKENKDLVGILTSKSNTVKIDNRYYYKSAIINDNNGYISAYYFPESLIAFSALKSCIIIILGCFTFCLVSVILFFVSSRLSSKKVAMLEEGMRQVSMNNLSYRIPAGNQNDEYTRIAMKFNEMCDDLENAIEQGYKYQLRQKNAQIYALQTSITPHFLYNVLEAIRVNLLENSNNDAAEMIVLLSRMYRSQFKGAMFIPVREEISNCNIYLDLFALRYDYQFTCDLDISPDVMEYSIPKYTLQPIIENYFVHGMKQGYNNKIVIAAAKQEETIVFKVTDNGKGMDEKTVQDINRKLDDNELNKESSFGLANVNERIKLVYGNEYGISLTSIQDQYTEVTVRIKAAYSEEFKNFTFDS
jgi:Predicted signal transduction protein with a C-terminal ATPase domain